MSEITKGAPNARRTWSEAQVEQLLNSMVRKILRGKTMKLVTEAGAPDRLVMLPRGEYRLVELKTESGNLSEIQKVWHKRAERFGVKVAVLYGPDEVEDWVAETHREVFGGSLG